MMEKIICLCFITVTAFTGCVSKSTPPPKPADEPVIRETPTPNHLNLARELVGQAYYEVALTQLNLHREQHPNDPDAAYLLGVCYRETGQLDLAATWFEKAIRQDKNPADAYHGLALSLDAAEKHKQAEKAFVQALSLNPARPDFYNNAGMFFLRQGHLEKGEVLFRQSLSLDPSYTLAKNNLVLCLGLQHKASDALALLLSFSPEPQAYYNMGMVHAMQNDYGRAADMFEKALASDGSFKAAKDALDSLRLAQ